MMGAGGRTRSSSPCYRILDPHCVPIETYISKSSSSNAGRISRIALVIGVLCILGATFYSKSQHSSPPALDNNYIFQSQRQRVEVGSPKNKPPNIVFVLADDLGHNDLGFSFQPGGYHSKIETPRIDSLATRDGTVILDQCYSMRKPNVAFLVALNVYILFCIFFVTCFFFFFFFFMKY